MEIELHNRNGFKLRWVTWFHMFTNFNFSYTEAGYLLWPWRLGNAGNFAKGMLAFEI